MNFTVALAEDNKVNRTTFLQKITVLGNMQVIFIAANGHECLEQLKGVPPAKLPQVIFMDLEMPQMDGIETIRLAKSLYPEIHFIVLTVFDDDEKIFEVDMVDMQGKTSQMKTKVHNPDYSAKRNCDALKPMFEKENVLVNGKIGGANSMLIDANKMLEVMIKNYNEKGVTMYTPYGN